MSKQYLHHTIQKTLLERIKSGTYVQGEKIPGTKDLALEFSTSSVTIDRALAALVEQGYITRKAKRGSYINPKAEWPSSSEQRTRQNAFYSLVMRDSPSPYFWKNTIKGIHDAIRRHDHDIVFGYIDENLAAAKEYITSLHRKGVRGIIFAPLSMPTEAEYEKFNSALIDVIAQHDIPLILVDRFLKSRDVSYIVSRDYEAAVRLTEHLLATGSKKPLCLTHLHNSPFEARVRGFRDTLAAHGFTHPEERIIDIAPGLNIFDANDAEKFAPLFGSFPPFDGIFAVNALNLYACVNTLRLKRDPKLKDLRFVNFDDIGLLNIEGLSLSAIQQSHRIGYMAGEILLTMIEKWRDSTFRVSKNYCFKEYRLN